MNLERFSTFLRGMRIKKGLTQQNVADYLSVTDKAVSKWERGVAMPDMTLIAHLANLLGVSISELLEAKLENLQSSRYSEAEETPASRKADEVGNDVYIVPDVTPRVVSPLLFGSNLEHTRSSIYGGLSAEMLRNRKFAGKPSRIGCAVEWFPIGEKVHYSMAKSYTLHTEPEKMRRRNECNAQQIHNMGYSASCGIGQRCLNILSHKPYRMEIVLKAAQDTELCVCLQSNDRTRTYAQVSFSLSGSTDWETYCSTMLSEENDDNAVFAVTFCVEGSVTVGAVSLMPEDNFHGMRRDVVDLLKKTGVTVLRWPGGNFAGEYRWKDGLLGRNQRAPQQAYTEIETQPYSYGYDFHEINTDDFIALCREIHAESFITINPAWDSPEDCAQWVEYCNGDETTVFGRKRIERGFREPYCVQLWSLGNEFGYGHMEGMNSPTDYSSIVRKCAEAMKRVEKNITFVSSGPYPNEEWFRYSAVPLHDIAPNFSYHHYGRYMQSPDSEDDVNFANRAELKEGYNRMLADVGYVEDVFRKMQPAIGDKLKICFDEWNLWYEWYRKAGVAEAIYAGHMLHMLISHADDYNLFMACYFEMINEGGIEVNPNTAELTPLGIIFAVMTEHSNGRICFTDMAKRAIATEKNGILTITALNDSFDTEQTFHIKKTGKIFKAVLYSSDSVLPYSCFTVVDAPVQEEDGIYHITLPAHSFALLQIEKN